MAHKGKKHGPKAKPARSRGAARTTAEPSPPIAAPSSATAPGAPSIFGHPPSDADRIGRDDARAPRETHPAGAETAPRATGSADSVGLFNGKLLEIAAGNVSAAGDLVSALSRATTLGEIAAVNADHLRRRFDALTTQGRELLLLAEKVAFDALRPGSDDATRS